MNVEIGTEAALGIFVAVTSRRFQPTSPKQYFFIAFIYVFLKGPNLEIFSSRVFTQICFVWVSDLGISQKVQNFYGLGLKIVILYF
jgi:hypothetical protein